ncbi:MAG TPA: MmgE/PrpD family protein, partial [Hyphomicrobiaceae bacterium]|nr:MmgE/PrpD family protein [Hyphomicrobiaceae bacterium]
MARTVAEELGAYAAAELARPLAPEIEHHARRALIDWFAALFPGTLISPARELFTALDDEIGHGGAWVYGLDRRAPIRTAALVNGAVSHAVEFDDI